MGTAGGRHVSDSVHTCVGGAGISPELWEFAGSWGHVNHRDGNCECLSSDHTGAYVHDLALMHRECLTVPELEDASVYTGGSGGG